MARAIWNGVVVAESDAGHVVEGNYYFPPDAVDRRYVRDSATHTTCPWKGIASYYHLDVHGAVNEDAAWYYPAPSAAAQSIAGHVASGRASRSNADERARDRGPDATSSQCGSV